MKTGLLCFDELGVGGCHVYLYNAVVVVTEGEVTVSVNQAVFWHYVMMALLKREVIDYTTRFNFMKLFIRDIQVAYLCPDR